MCVFVCERERERETLTNSSWEAMQQAASRFQNQRCMYIWDFCGGFPDGSVVENLPANAGDAGLILGLGRSLGGGNDNPLQCSCQENPMDR